MKLSEVFEDNENKRIDPEFFNKMAQTAYLRLKHCRRFGDLVKDGYRVIYENTKAIDRKDGIAGGLPFFLQATDIETPFISDNGMVCVGMDDWLRYPKGRIIPGEILIEVKGKAEKVAIVPHDFPKNTLVTGTVYKMTVQDELDKYLLIFYLTSKYGQALKERQKTNLLVSFISKTDLFNIPVPDFSPSFKELLRKSFLTADACHNQGKEFLKQAEQALLRTLDLEDWTPPEPLTYSRRASEVFKANRIDAEYYHPAKKAFIDQLGSQPGKPLEAHYEAIREMFDPKSANAGEVVRNFDLPDALQPVLDDEKKTMFASEVGSLKKRFSAGDVVISRLRAYLREIALVRTSANVPSVGSSEFIVLRPRNEENPKLSRAALLVFLRSHPVQTILKWSQDGSHHPRFSDEALLNIPVPDVVCDIAPKIERLFEEILIARTKSRALLEQAKRAVEIAIEDSEAAAIKYLKEI